MSNSPDQQINQTVKNRRLQLPSTSPFMSESFGSKSKPSWAFAIRQAHNGYIIEYKCEEHICTLLTDVGEFIQNTLRCSSLK